MLILAFESSAKAASVALFRDQVLLAEQFQNNGKTHSATLMPMAESILKDCGVRPEELSCIAVAKGPGSFTGIRIGVSAAKGMAWAAEKPCCGVSTLEAMAAQLQHVSGIICPVMDARRSQVYNALFSSDGETLTRLTEDRAISLEELGEELRNYEKTIFLVGDGTKLCYNTLKASIPALTLPSAHLEMQRATGVGMAAFRMIQAGQLETPQQLTPNYLRLSQAERERLEKLNRLKGEN